MLGRGAPDLDGDAMSRLEQLNNEQRAAHDAILEWLSDQSSGPFFLLRGYAGTGKTFTARAIVESFKGRVVFTAPTNKATKVLKVSLSEPGYFPQCCTIYSLLGLRMEANGEVKELATPEEDIDLGDYDLCFVDEGSMINEQVLGFIIAASTNFNVKFLFMGDAAQLPPVGERKSAIWDIRPEAVLEKVERHDNQILELCTRLRKVVDLPAPTVKLANNNDGIEGVFMPPPGEFAKLVRRRAAEGSFIKPNSEKVIAWRNVTVDSYNRMIRMMIYAELLEKLDGQPLPQWVTGDRVIYTSPSKDLDDNPLTSTDDEGIIQTVAEDFHPLYGSFPIYRLRIALDDNRVVTAFALHESGAKAFTEESERIATRARKEKRFWREYWAFREAFHSLRHAYAITAHRAQGSTYEAAFVDWRDILLNRNRQEAYRCLYVACSRPKKELYLG